MDENLHVVSEVIPSTSVIRHSNTQVINVSKYTMVEFMALINYQQASQISTQNPGKSGFCTVPI